MAQSEQPRPVVVIGGGTGAPQLLQALARLDLPGPLILIVPVTDTGRSTGAARRLFGIPGPGDIRHALTTLAGTESGWARLLERRLEAEGNPDLDGMAIGNLVLAGLVQQVGDIGRASRVVQQLLDVAQSVLPVSVEDLHLSAVLEDGTRVSGELEVRRPGKAPIAELEVEGQTAGAWPPVLEALEQARAIVIGPGSLWTSLGGVLAVHGVCEAIGRSRARVAFVCNTTTQPGQTDGYSFLAHVVALGRLLGRTPDVVIGNTGKLGEAEEQDLAEHGLHLVCPEETGTVRLEGHGVEVVGGDIVLRSDGAPRLWQKLHTAYHDMDKLATVVASVIR